MESALMLILKCFYPCKLERDRGTFGVYMSPKVVFPPTNTISYKLLHLSYNVYNLVSLKCN